MPNLTPPSVLLRTQSDERLVVLARGGSERAFEAIVERYRGVLLRGARRFLPDARAEDALQQAYLSAWSALQRGDEVRDLRAWLYKIVVNTALNQLRVSGYDYAELRESLRGGEAPQEEMERRAVVRETLTALAGLPERQREALLRIAVEGRSQDEVARELGVSEGAVRQLVHRARLTLRAAATAVVPLPLAQWAAAAGLSGASAPTAERIAELVAGAGAGAFAAKAGTVAVLATTTAIAGPAIVTSGGDEPARSARAPQAEAERRGRERPPPAARPGPAAPVVVLVPGEPRRRASSERESSRKRSDSRRARSSRPARTFDSSDPGPGSSGSGSSGSGSSGSGSSGSGSSGSGRSGSGSGSSGSGSSGSDRSGSSGSGSSGSGRSGSSGSGSSGSGSSGSGSGSSGSGSSGSGSSGSGSSGSGSSGSNSGPGSGEETSGSDNSGPGSGDGGDTDNSGPGSGDDSSGASGSGSGSSGSSGSGSSGSGSGDDGQR